MSGSDDQNETDLPHSDGTYTEHFLYESITTQDEAKHFLRHWMWSGLEIPLPDSMFELRTVLEPEDFDELIKRVRELDDDAPWQDEPPDPDLYSKPGELIRTLAYEIEHEWDTFDREVEAAMAAHDDMFPLAPSDDDVRNPLGSIGSEEDSPYTFVADEASPYENWGARCATGNLPYSQRDDD